VKNVIRYIIASLAVFIVVFLLSNVMSGIKIKPVDRLQLTLKDTITLDQLVEKTPSLAILDREKNIVRSQGDYFSTLVKLQKNRDVLTINSVPYLPDFSWADYGDKLWSTLQKYAEGDFGSIRGMTSGITKPILEEIGLMFTRTMSYFAAAFVFAVALGFAAAIAATVFKRIGRIFDGIHKVFVALPDFLLIILLILLVIFISKFTTQRVILVMQLGDEIPFLIPFLTCALLPAVLIYGAVRNGLQREMSRPYVVTAIAKGMPRTSIILRHALRNVLEDIFSILPRATTAAVGTMIIVESSCSILGLGGYITFRFFFANDVVPFICLILALIAAAMQIVFALLRKWLVVSTKEA